MEAAFAKTWVPGPAVTGFTTVLPFLEAGFGALLILGWFTRYAAAGAGLLLMNLTIGLVILGNSQGAGLNVVYMIGLFLVLYTEEDNALPVDRLLL